jgi:hypothetical protein
MLNQEEKQQFIKFQQLGVFKNESEYENILRFEEKKEDIQREKSAKGFMKTLTKNSTKSVAKAK